MNIQRLKPDLLNPILKQKIIQTINPPREDYWGPVKDLFSDIYMDYIKPNIYLVIFIIIIIIILIYRYNVTQEKRRLQLLHPRLHHNNNTINDKQIDSNDLALLIYNQQKENSREPSINTSNGYAYPIYPHYGSNGYLMKSNHDTPAK